MPYDEGMIDTKGMITVAEAAKRMNRSIEQVRRKLREGKLKGQRVGNQWFVDEEGLRRLGAKEPLIHPEVIAEVDRLRREAAERNPGYVWDAVEMVQRSREEDLP
jgi:excisionase family DNA binding protein